MADNKIVSINEDAPVQVFNSSLPVTRSMLDTIKEQRKMLAEFVSSQLRKDIDFGIIPGTKKPSLFKPGAEKIRGLFGLNIRTECTNQVIDHDKNFAMFSYKSQVYKGENLIAECEGSTNSFEKKYKERTVWLYNPKTKKKEPETEITPIYDIMNTLQKMAQKRSFVGAVILAVGASDFFTQDIDDPEDARTVGAVPKSEEAPSAIPNVVNVSAAPVVNHSDKVIIEALVEYNDREKARSAGFKWDTVNKRWLKEVSRTDDGEYPFETREI